MTWLRRDAGLVSGLEHLPSSSGSAAPPAPPRSLIFPGIGLEQEKRFLRGQPPSGSGSAPCLGGGGQDSSGLGESRGLHGGSPPGPPASPRQEAHSEGVRGPLRPCHCHLRIPGGLWASAQRVCGTPPTAQGPEATSSAALPQPRGDPGRAIPGLLVGRIAGLYVTLAPVALPPAKSGPD